RHAPRAGPHPAAYGEPLRFVRDPANKAENIALLVDKLKLAQPTAERTYAQLLDPGFGFTPDAKFDAEGFRNMLALRAEIERKPDATPPAPAKYADLGYYDRQLKALTPTRGQRRAASCPRWRNFSARSWARFRLRAPRFGGLKPVRSSRSERRRVALPTIRRRACPSPR